MSEILATGSERVAPLLPLIRLRGIMASYGRLPSGPNGLGRGRPGALETARQAAARQALEHAEAAGPSASPLLLRTLEVGTGGAAELAARLLATCAGHWGSRQRVRVMERLRALSQMRFLRIERRLLAEAVIDELTEELAAKRAPRPGQIAGPGRALQKEQRSADMPPADPNAATGASRAPGLRVRDSVRELVRGLGAPADLRGAADLIVAQVDEQELGLLCVELLKHGGPIGHRLVEAIREQPRPSTSRLTVSRGRRAQSSGPLRQAGPSRVVRRPRPHVKSKAFGPESPRERRHPARLLDEAMYLLANDQPAEAALRLERMVEQRPELIAGQSLLGLARLRAGQIEAAIAPLTEACSAEPSIPTHYFVLGLAFAHARRHGQAYLAFEAYLGLEDVTPEAHERRGFARVYTEDFSRRAATRSPGHEPSAVAQADACFNLASRRHRAGAAAGARAAIEQANRILPEQPAFRSALATVLDA